MIENKKKKRNRIILCLCSILVVFASVFAFVPINKEAKTVYADTVTSDYSFSGSNISSKTTFTNGLFSENLISYPYPLSIKTVNGVTFTELENGAVSVSGQISSSIWTSYNLVSNFKLSAGKYTLQLFSDTTDSDMAVVIHYNSINAGVGTSNSYTFTLTEDTTCSIDLQLFPDSTYVYSNDVFKPMFVKGSATNYQPYQDSTQVNYEFDLSSMATILDGFINGVAIKSTIYDTFGYEYKLTQFAGTSVPTIDNVANVNALYYHDSNSFPNPVGNLSYTRYNSNTQLLDEDYKFELYFTTSIVGNNPIQYNFKSNVSYIVLGSYNDFSSYFNQSNTYGTQFIDLSTAKYNFISYVSAENVSLNIIIPLDSPFSTDYWQYRTYYVESISDSDANGIYNTGYNAGYNAGYNSGETNGYDNGYKVGNNIGYNSGYSDGYNENHQYTFLDLVSSTIDAPMTYFQELFNFELLGVNLQGFLMALFTLCVIVTIFRLCLGK